MRQMLLFKFCSFCRILTSVTAGFQKNHEILLHQIGGITFLINKNLMPFFLQLLSSFSSLIFSAFTLDLTGIPLIFSTCCSQEIIIKKSPNKAMIFFIPNYFFQLLKGFLLSWEL